MYTIILSNRARKALDRLPDEIVARVFVLLETLKQEPRPHGTKKLRGQEGYRVRLGRYRVLLEVDDDTKTVLILDILDRKDAYRK